MKGEVARVLKAAQDAGHEPPQVVLEALDIWPACMPYWEAFHMLDGSRTYGGGMGVIPQGLAYTEMAAYARDHGLAETRSELDLFLRLVRAQDTEWLNWHAEQAKAKAPHGGR